MQIEQVDGVVAKIGHSRNEALQCGDRPGRSAESASSPSIPFPNNSSTTRAANGSSSVLPITNALAHQLLVAEPGANASLHGVAPGHQDEADADAAKEQDHPGRLLEHKAQELLQHSPGGRRHLDADLLQRVPQRITQNDRVGPCAGLYPCEQVGNHAYPGDREREQQCHLAHPRQKTSDLSSEPKYHCDVSNLEFWSAI